LTLACAPQPNPLRCSPQRTSLSSAPSAEQSRWPSSFGSAKDAHKTKTTPAELSDQLKVSEKEKSGQALLSSQKQRRWSRTKKARFRCRSNTRRHRCCYSASLRRKQTNRNHSSGGGVGREGGSGRSGACGCHGRPAVQNSNFETNRLYN
jgi:hypothetical protein